MENKKIQFILCIFFTGVLFFSSESFSTELKIGDQAPNLIGNNATDGSRLDLYRIMTQMRFKKDRKGKLVIGVNGKYISEFIEHVVVLNFFSKTCLPCLREIPMFNRIADKYWNKSIVFLYVNVDFDADEAEAKRLIRKHNIESPMIIVNPEEAVRKYNADMLPRLFVIDKKGKVARIIEGFNENLESELSSVIDSLL